MLTVQKHNNIDVMSSVDLAELCGVRHDHFMTKAQKVLGDTLPNFREREKYNNGRNERTILMLPEREACLMAMSYSYELQAKVYDSWQEMKNKQPKLPQTFAEALQLAADQAKQLELQAPKVAFVEKLVERTTEMNSTQIAQKFGKSAIWLNKQLEELGVFNKNVKRGRAFKQWFVDGGYGVMKQTEQGYSQALFTPAGELWIYEKLTSEGVL
ncbi:MAG: phage antirepressor KilAC domain-containing protein [Marinomonas sp.]